MGHPWKECKSERKCCINYEGDHGTMSMKCPEKEIIINKRKEAKYKENETYTNITKKNITNNKGIDNQSPMDYDTHSKIFTCMVQHIS